MNPLKWKCEHQVALGLAILIGAILGVVVGYFVYAAAYSEASTFTRWIKSAADTRGIMAGAPASVMNTPNFFR